MKNMSQLAAAAVLAAAMSPVSATTTVENGVGCQTCVKQGVSVLNKGSASSRFNSETIAKSGCIE